MSEFSSLCKLLLKRNVHYVYLDVNDCMPNPFKNGGNCTDGVNEYSCTCVLGFTGTDCETGKLLGSILRKSLIIIKDVRI